MKRVFYLTVLSIFVLSTLIATVACGSNGQETPAPAPAPAPTPTPEPTPTPPEDTSKPKTDDPDNPYEILITENGFEPKTLAVPIGTKVTWYNIDRSSNARHWVKAKDGSFDTRVIPVDARMSWTANKKGEFEYYCVYHRDREEEQGIIIVE